jgi:WD40 repeat protein
LLHHVRAQASGGDLTCIAWNHAANDPFMFATGSHDGAIRIWTTPPPPSLRNSQSFVIDIRAPSPGVASFVEAGGQPSPAPSLSPNTSGRTTPNKAPQSLFSQEIQYSPITDTFVQHSPAEFGESSRLSPPPRSRPGSPERILLREGDIPMGDGKRVIFQTPRNSMDR